MVRSAARLRKCLARMGVQSGNLGRAERVERATLRNTQRAYGKDEAVEDHQAGDEQGYTIPG